MKSLARFGAVERPLAAAALRSAIRNPTLRAFAYLCNQGQMSPPDRAQRLCVHHLDYVIILDHVQQKWDISIKMLLYVVMKKNIVKNLH